MLAKAHRLRRRRDFADTVRAGARRGSGAVVLHLRRDAAPSGRRVGFVVARPVGGAVIRNTVKRRLRHIAAARLDQLPTGSALVVRAQPGAACRPYNQLVGDFDAALTGVLERGGQR